MFLIISGKSKSMLEIQIFRYLGACVPVKVSSLGWLTGHTASDCLLLKVSGSSFDSAEVS